MNYSAIPIELFKVGQYFTCRHSEVKKDVPKRETNGTSWMHNLCFLSGKLAFIVLVVLLIERTYGTFVHYLQYPTYFETRYVSQFHAQMPALTICPLKGYKENVLKVSIWIFN